MEDLNERFFTMMPLDMLAEVASATLQNDPSIISFYKSRAACNFNKTVSSKKPANTSERLTLDQIRALSEKMLLEMFSELSSDEIRKNYSFKCYLMPDKCSATFTSFGNEARSRLQMKSHLLSHINDLILESNGIDDSRFTAEPLHVLRKRLKDQSPKCKKKTKQSTAKRKMSKTHSKKDQLRKKVESSKQKIPKDADYDSEDSYESSKQMHITFSPKNCNDEFFSHSKKGESTSTVDSNFRGISTEDNHYISVSNNDVPKESSFQNFFKERTLLDLHDDSYLYSLDEMSDSDETGDVSMDISKRKSSVSSSCDSQDDIQWSVTKEDTDYSNSNAHSDTSSPCDSEPLSSHQDHNYFSVTGEIDNSECSTESRTMEDLMESAHCSEVAEQLIIPTPPFPFIYIPLLPHISEVQEVDGTCSASRDQWLYKSYTDEFHDNSSDTSDFQCGALSDVEEDECQHESKSDRMDSIELEIDESCHLSNVLLDESSSNYAISEDSEGKTPDAISVENDLTMNCPLKE